MIEVIDARPPAGLWLCDICNETCAENHIANQKCYLTGWGLYCERDAKEYMNKEQTKISGFPIVRVFHEGDSLQGYREERPD